MKSSTDHLWTIVLAGGDGSRLRSLTVDQDGTPLPKQFWPIDDRTTMLQWTLARAAGWTSRYRTVPIVSAAHRRYWERELKDIPCWNVVVQPENRGTAAGILLPLLDVLSRDREATVVIMPSDHHVADEKVLSGSVRQAVAALDHDPDRVILLGITPEDADPELGYIVPAPGNRVSRPVAAFVEKPPAREARRLIDDGAVWNSFIFVVRGTALLRLFAWTERPLLDRFLTEMGTAGWTEPALRKLYETLPSRDFSRHVLQKRPDLLRVLVVPRCGWTDLGTPLRLNSWRRSGSKVRVTERRLAPAS